MPIKRPELPLIALKTEKTRDRSIKIKVNQETYRLICEMAEANNVRLEDVVYRAVMREYVFGEER